MWKWVNSTWVTVLESLQVDKGKGIRTEEIINRKEEYGENIITLKTRKSIKKIIFNILKKPFVIILLIVTGLAIYNLDLYGIVPLLLLIFSFKILKQMEQKEYKIYESLQQLNSSSCRVMRNGVFQTIDVKEVVVGDIVYVEEGDIIPADLRLIEDENLKVDENIITGEDTVVEKNKTFILDRNIGITEMKNILFKGTKVVRGEGSGVVVQVGDRTELGRILNYLSTSKEEDEDNIVKSIIRWINKWSLIVFLVAIVIGVFVMIIRGDILQGIKAVYKSIIFICPVYIGTVFIMSKNIFDRALKQNNSSINDINVIKKLNKIDRILLEKVGTLTEEIEVLKNIYTDGEEVNLKDKDSFKKHNSNRILNIAYFTNGKDNLAGVSIDEYIESLNLEEGILNSGKFLFKNPYDNERRITTYVNSIEEFYRAHIKGTVDGVLEKCTHIMKNGVEIEITQEEIRNIKEKDIEYSSKGYDVIALAYRNFSYEPSAKENIESHLVFVGLMAFFNPVRETAKDFIYNCYENCIIPIIFTQDNKLSALTLAENIGLKARLQNVITGIEIDYTLREEFERNLNKFYIFSRTDYYQRLNIASFLENDGYKLLVTGEKIKDIPVMTTAHVGIGVGENISPLVKKLSDIYIEKDYLNGILHVIEYSKGLIKGVDKSRGVINKIIILTSLFAPIYMLTTDGIPLIFLLSFSIITLPILILSVLNIYVKKSFWIRKAGLMYILINISAIISDYYLNKTIFVEIINLIMTLTIALVYYNAKKHIE